MDGVAVAALAGTAIFAAGALALRRLSARELATRFAKNVLTPGALCFAGLCALFLWASSPMVVWWGDDSGYWALEVKSLWAYGGLVGADRHLALSFGTYPPGVQLLQWWAMHALGQWSEPALYATLFITYAALLLPLLERVRWKRCWLVPFAFAGVLAFPYWGSVLSYVILSVGLALCAMVLIKQSGAFFAALAIVFMLVMKRGRGLSRSGIWLSLLSPALVFASWTLFCRAAGLTSYHTSTLGNTLSGILSGTFTLPDGAGQVAPAMLKRCSSRWSTTAPSCPFW